MVVSYCGAVSKKCALRGRPIDYYCFYVRRTARWDLGHRDDHSQTAGVRRDLKTPNAHRVSSIASSGKHMTGRRLIHIDGGGDKNQSD